MGASFLFAKITYGNEATKNIGAFNELKEYVEMWNDDGHLYEITGESFMFFYENIFEEKKQKMSAELVNLVENIKAEFDTTNSDVVHIQYMP